MRPGPAQAKPKGSRGLLQQSTASPES